MLKQMLEKDWYELANQRLPNPDDELNNSPYDSVLGKNMADDARNVVGGQLNIKDFHKTYYSTLVGEFRDVGEEAAYEEDDKDQAIKLGMLIDLQNCVGGDSCIVVCKAENLTPPGISYYVILEKEIGDFPHLAK